MTGLPPSIRIDVIEDQQFTRDLEVERLQARAGPQARVRGFASVEDFMVAGDPGDVVVLDLGLDTGGLEGATAIEMLNRHGLLVLVLSGSHSAEVIERAHAAGARGYVGKDTADLDDVVAAIGEVLAGRTYVDAKLLERVGAAARKKLSLRQQEVLRLEALGFNVGQIARRLEPPLAEGGVKRHIEHIKEIYPECGKQTDRARLAIRLGLVTPWELPPGSLSGS
jgi:DNA-binding NarL/FixJ family response regulator